MKKVFTLVALIGLTTASFATSMASSTGEIKTTKSIQATPTHIEAPAHLVNVVEQEAVNSFDLVCQLTEMTRVKVVIWNEANRAVFTEVLRDDEPIRRPYNLSTLPAGQYTISVKGVQDGTYNQVVTVE